MIYTSRYNYIGDNRLDITVKGQDPIGRIFAPTWEMVTQVKNGLMSKKEYTEKYYSLMRKSHRDHKEIWEELLKKDVVFVCFCRKSEFCHRYILAEIFTKLGATYQGEI